MVFIAWFLLPFCLFAQDLEVRLATRVSLTPIYLSSFSDDAMREVLKNDLNQSGYATVLEKQPNLEEALQNRFDLALWKKQKIPFCLAAKIVQNRLEMTAYNIEQGTSKKYPPIPLERKAIHKLADAIQFDFFGRQGIGSLKLIYTVKTKNPKQEPPFLSEIWTCDADGANAIQVTKENSFCLSPQFIPGSSSDFLYTSEKNGQSKIYRASLSNPEGVLMVDLRGNQALATMKDNLMAFIADTAGRPDLFIQNFDAMGKMAGKARQLFSQARATQASPTLSPDGKKIAFVSDKDGPPRIYLLDVAQKKSHPQLLTKQNRENTSPSWSPDGTKLAYSAGVDGVRQIWIYDFVTGAEMPLTSGLENKENPSWAPDSFHLVYNTEGQDKCDLYLINLKSSEPVNIGKGRFASWQQW